MCIRDSHKTLPTITFSAKRINDVELFPYRELIKNNLSAVMVAHMEIPSLEKEPKKPSTLSKNIITKLLKKKMNGKRPEETKDILKLKSFLNYRGFEFQDIDKAFDLLNKEN